MCLPFSQGYPFHTCPEPKVAPVDIPLPLEIVELPPFQVNPSYRVQGVESPLEIADRVVVGASLPAPRQRCPSSCPAGQKGSPGQKVMFFLFFFCTSTAYVSFSFFLFFFCCSHNEACKESLKRWLPSVFSNSICFTFQIPSSSKMSISDVLKRREKEEKMARVVTEATAAAAPSQPARAPRC